MQIGFGIIPLQDAPFSLLLSMKTIINLTQ